MNSTGAGGPSGCRTGMAAPPLFTVSQWQELEHQSLIFKYLMAGIPVPPDLVLPIQKSFESVSARFYHHPSMAYCSFYGKKVDPEPGRCRRTDGKKWRCSKDAYPDSKYCERHMNRGRNRSRKPVESHTASQSSSTLTSLNFSGVSHGAGNFENFPLNSFANSQGGPAGSGANPVHINMEPISYGTPSNSDYRYIHGYKAEVGEHSLFEASGSNKGFQMNSPLDSTWSLMPSSRVSSFPPSKSSDNSILQNTYPHNLFSSSEFASGEAVKQEGQSLRPFFDEWPKTRDSWSDLEEERSNQASFSTTQLSISTPIFPTSSQSPHDN